MNPLLTCSWHVFTNLVSTIWTVNDVPGKEPLERPPNSRRFQGSEGSFQGIFHLEKPFWPLSTHLWGLSRGLSLGHHWRFILYNQSYADGKIYLWIGALHTLIPGHRLNLGHIIILKCTFIPGTLVHTIILEQTICVCLISLYNLNIKDARRAVPCNPEY